MKRKIIRIRRKLRDTFRFAKKNYKMIVSVIVVVLLVVVCLSSVISERSKIYQDTGRMIAITPLYDEPAMAPAYARTPYTALELTEEAKKASGFVNDDVGAFSGTKTLTEQEQKDKAALEALLASSENSVAGSSVRERAEARLKKYQLNKKQTINSNTTVTITQNATATAGTGGGNVGQVIMAKSGQNGAYLGRFLITAYCPCIECCGKTDGVTACGRIATSNHTLAADASVPFYTKLIINGQVYEVEDRGGAINGNHLDMFFNSHSEAMQWGTKYCDVYLYSENGSSDSSN